MQIMCCSFWIEATEINKIIKWSRKVRTSISFAPPDMFKTKIYLQSKPTLPFLKNEIALTIFSI